MSETVQAWGEWCSTDQAAARSGVRAVWDECRNQNMTPVAQVLVVDAERCDGKVRCQSSTRAVRNG